MKIKPKKLKKVDAENQEKLVINLERIQHEIISCCEFKEYSSSFNWDDEINLGGQVCICISTLL